MTEVEMRRLRPRARIAFKKGARMGDGKVALRSFEATFISEHRGRLRVTPSAQPVEVSDDVTDSGGIKMLGELYVDRRDGEVIPPERVNIAMPPAQTFKAETGVLWSALSGINVVGERWECDGARNLDLIEFLPGTNARLEEMKLPGIPRSAADPSGPALVSMPTDLGGQRFWLPTAWVTTPSA